MDTTFLSYLLVFTLLFILVLYLYQIKPNIFNTTNNKTNTKHSGESFLPIIFDSCNSQRTRGMPVHRIGPVYNFHQKFNKYNPNSNVPEMGWRNFYLANFNNNQIPNQDPFDGTVIRNFLNNLENVDNIYRKCF